MMTLKRMPGAAALAGALTVLALIATQGDQASAASSGMTFDEIMTSAAAAGKMSNGDGHYWAFRKSGDAWEVDGARGYKARASEKAPDEISIDGFPHNWGANGVYGFRKTGGRCELASKRSRHNLTWDC